MNKFSSKKSLNKAGRSPKTPARTNVGATKNAWTSGMPVITVSKGAAPAATPPAWRKSKTA